LINPLRTSDGGENQQPIMIAESTVRAIDVGCLILLR